MSPILYRIAMYGLPTSSGKDSKNNIWYATAKRDSPHYAGVRFQERVEAAFKRLYLVPLLAVMLAVSWLIWPAVEAPLMAFIAWIIIGGISTQLAPLIELNEMRGQSVETYIRWKYYGEDYDAAEFANAEQLTAEWSQYRKKGAFKGDTALAVKARLKEWRPWAERMCKHFDEEIAFYHRMKR